MVTENKVDKVCEAAEAPATFDSDVLRKEKGEKVTDKKKQQTDTAGQELNCSVQSSVVVSLTLTAL